MTSRSTSEHPSRPFLDLSVNIQVDWSWRPLNWLWGVTRLLHSVFADDRHALNCGQPDCHCQWASLLGLIIVINMLTPSLDWQPCLVVHHHHNWRTCMLQLPWWKPWLPRLRTTDAKLQSFVCITVNPVNKYPSENKYPSSFFLLKFAFGCNAPKVHSPQI